MQCHQQQPLTLPRSLSMDRPRTMYLQSNFQSYSTWQIRTHASDTTILMYYCGHTPIKLSQLTSG